METVEIDGYAVSYEYEPGDDCYVIESPAAVIIREVKIGDRDVLPLLMKLGAVERLEELVIEEHESRLAIPKEAA